MAEKRANQSMAYRREPERYYIDGNTARRLNEQPETPKRRNKAVQSRPKQRTVQHKKRVSVFDLKYTRGFEVYTVSCDICRYYPSCLFYVFTFQFCIEEE